MVRALLSEVVKEAFVGGVHSVHFFSLVKSRSSFVNLTSVINGNCFFA